MQNNDIDGVCEFGNTKKAMKAGQKHKSIEIREGVSDLSTVYTLYTVYISHKES